MTMCKTNFRGSEADHKQWCVAGNRENFAPYRQPNFLVKIGKEYAWGQEMKYYLKYRSI